MLPMEEAQSESGVGGDGPTTLPMPAMGGDGASANQSELLEGRERFLQVSLYHLWRVQHRPLVSVEQICLNQPLMLISLVPTLPMEVSKSTRRWRFMSLLYLSLPTV